MKPKHTFRGVVIHESQPRFAGVKRPLPSAQAPKAADPARVRVAREVSGRGGKGVSVISGLPLDATALEELATRLKKLCGAGGAVKEDVIEIQGDHRDRLVAELCKLGYDAKRSGG
ncbi:MAG TPA: stress response translation initiation inhibitor YciH [Steroidobacteraceae bacterium]